MHRTKYAYPHALHTATHAPLSFHLASFPSAYIQQILNVAAGLLRSKKKKKPCGQDVMRASSSRCGQTHGLFLCGRELPGFCIAADWSCRKSLLQVVAQTYIRVVNAMFAAPCWVCWTGPWRQMPRSANNSVPRPLSALIISFVLQKVTIISWHLVGAGEVK